MINTNLLTNLKTNSRLRKPYGTSIYVSISAIFFYENMKGEFLSYSGWVRWVLSEFECIQFWDLREGEKELGGKVIDVLVYGFDL